jgi:hypothetical protein
MTRFGLLFPEPDREGASPLPDIRSLRPSLDPGSSVLLRAQRTQIRDGVREADHCVRPSVLLSVERRGMAGIEAAGNRVVRIVEPEAHMKRMRRTETCGWIEAKYLVEEDGIDRDLGHAVGISLQVGLVPGKAEIHKAWVRLSVRQQISVLNCEKIEGEVRFDVLSAQSERIMQRSSLDYHGSGGCWPSLHPKTVDKLRLSHQIKSDLFHVLGERGRDRCHKADCGDCEGKSTFH